MTLEQIIQEAKAKYPIYLKDDPAKGIKKSCRTEKALHTFMQNQYIERLKKEHKLD
jgi:hypothetical protein